MEYIVYSNNNGEYNVLKHDNLKDAHDTFNELQKEGNYSYLELGIDNIDVDGTYPIIRKLKK